MLPEVLQQTTLANNHWCLAINVAEGLPCFDGHFDQHPILAGVVQIEWVVRFTEAKSGERYDFLGLKNMKFMRPIKPGYQVNLELQLDRSKQLIKFVMRKKSDDSVIYAKGSVLVRWDSDHV